MSPPKCDDLDYVHFLNRVFRLGLAALVPGQLLLARGLIFFTVWWLGAATVSSGCQMQPLPTSTPIPVAPTAAPTLMLPTLTPSPLPTIVPTPIPTPAELYAARFQQARALLAELPPPAVLPTEIVDIIIKAVRTYLEQAIDATQPVEPQIQELRRLLLGLRPEVQPALVVADLDGDGGDDLLMALPPLSFPVMAFLRQGNEYDPHPVPSPSVALTGGPLAGGTATIERVADVNGDGKNEVVLSCSYQGASATTTELYVAQWDGAAFKAIFTISISDWAGPASWKLVSRGATQDIVVTCQAFGVYDHKLLPHQTRTDTYRWQNGRYVLAASELSPARTLRQQVNVAEDAFLRGRYRDAVALYRRAIEDDSLEAEDVGGPEPDWRAYAWFRLGEIHALLGEETEARAAMEEAQKAGSVLAQLAQAFLEAYRDTASVARALAALQKVDLAGMLYRGEAGNLGPPIDALYVLYPGIAVAAFLESHPDTVSQPDDQLREALVSLGVAVEQLATGDLNADGGKEIVAVIALGDQKEVWVVAKRKEGWRAMLLASLRARQPTIEKVVPIGGTNKRAAVLRAAGSPDPWYIGWDGTNVVHLRDTDSYQVHYVELPYWVPSSLCPSG